MELYIYNYYLLFLFTLYVGRSYLVDVVLVRLGEKVVGVMVYGVGIFLGFKGFYFIIGLFLNVLVFIYLLLLLL